ncbi:MAG: Dps family protein [Myxococcota bacterium]
MEINTGIAEKSRREIADRLNGLLVETFALYLKTHYFHWNVTGPQFQSLHIMFEGQYNEIWLATDLIAERVRAIGGKAKYTEIPTFNESPATGEMISQLVEGHEAVIRLCREMFPLASDANDEVTADLLTQRMQIHEKTAWMLRSLC